MISEVKLKFGRAPGLAPETIKTTPVTVFVGPNNSGKSKILAEIHQMCQSGQQNATDVILHQLEFLPFGADDAKQHLESVRLKPRPGDAIQPEHTFVGKRGARHQVNELKLLEILQNPNARRNQCCSLYLAYNTLILDGKNRIGLVTAQQAGDLQQPPHSSLQVLFRDDARREEVRRIVKDAFSVHFVIDPTHLGQLRIRLSPVAPLDHRQERGIHDDAVQFHSRAIPIESLATALKRSRGSSWRSLRVIRA